MAVGEVMFIRKWCNNLMLGSLCLVLPIGCGHRQGTVAVAANPKIPPTTPQTMMLVPQSLSTYKSAPPAIQFDYPTDWVPDKALSASFAICAPKSAGAGYSSLSLDIPKMPWHLPGMISAKLVASGYISDMKKHQIHDAV